MRLPWCNLPRNRRRTAYRKIFDRLLQRIGHRGSRRFVRKLFAFRILGASRRRGVGVMDVAVRIRPFVKFGTGRRDGERGCQHQNPANREHVPPARNRNQRHDHPVMPQQRVDAAARARGTRRTTPAPAGCRPRARISSRKRSPALGIEHAVLLEQAVGVGGQHLGPLVAVVARRVAAGENVREAVRETVVGRRDQRRRPASRTSLPADRMRRRARRRGSNS